jgi:molybdate-binding protein/DNA-binding XRE family transcriptional regulator
MSNTKSEPRLHNDLRATRLRLGISQQELARAAHVTRQTISGIEAGIHSPSAAVALRLARALGGRVEDLFWMEEALPSITAVPAAGTPSGPTLRLALARVGPNWVAHPLHGDDAFQVDMVPADGIGTLDSGSSALRVELLDDARTLERTAVLAGCTPALSLWARAAERRHPGLRVHWTFANSVVALRALARGEVHLAGLHLEDPQTGEDNTSYARRFLDGRAATLINLGVWDEGLLVRSGNPLGLKSGADLARPDVRIVNREEGAGARMLLESALRADGVPFATVRGFDHLVFSHLEVARAVASGAADAGVSSACVAAAYGLGFLPLREVHYDLAIMKEYLEELPVRQLLATLENRWVRSQLRRLAGYDTGHTGEVMGEVAA